MPTHKLTNEIIAAAIQGFEGQKKQLDDQIAELRAMLSGSSVEAATTQEEATPGKRGGRRNSQQPRGTNGGSRSAMALSKNVQPEASRLNPPKQTKDECCWPESHRRRVRKRFALKRAADLAASKPPKKATGKKAATKASKKVAQVSSGWSLIHNR